VRIDLETVLNMTFASIITQSIETDHMVVQKFLAARDALKAGRCLGQRGGGRGGVQTDRER